MVSASIKLQEMTFVDKNICYIASLRMLYSLTLTYVFQGQIFQMSVSRKR